MRRRNLSGMATFGLVLLTLAAAGVGLLPGSLPLGATLVVMAAGLGALIVVVLRRASRMVPAPAAAGDEFPAANSDRAALHEGWDIRLARLLFYLGSLTVAETVWRPALGLTVSELFFMAAFVVSAFTALRGQPIVSVPVSVAAGVSIFAFGGVISTLSAHSLAQSGTEVAQAVYVMLLWFWTGAMVLRRRRHILLAMMLWVISVAVDGAGAILQVFGVGALTNPLEGTRATGFTDHANDLGGAAGIALVPALLLATRPAAGRMPSGLILRWLVVALVATGLVLSASVAGMAVGVVGVVVWLSSPAVRTPGRVSVVAALTCALIVVAAAGGRVTSPTERIQLTTSAPGTQPGAGSGEDRISMVKAAWQGIKESPIVGAGLDNSGKTVTFVSGGIPVLYQVHGAPLAAWYEAGVFGFIGFLVMVAALFSAAWSGFTAADTRHEVLVAWALFAALAAFLVWTLAVPFAFQEYGWIVGALVVAWRLRRDLEPRVATAPVWGQTPAGLRSPQLAPR